MKPVDHEYTLNNFVHYRDVLKRNGPAHEEVWLCDLVAFGLGVGVSPRLDDDDAISQHVCDSTGDNYYTSLDNRRYASMWDALCDHRRRMYFFDPGHAHDVWSMYHSLSSLRSGGFVGSTLVKLLRSNEDRLCYPLLAPMARFIDRRRSDSGVSSFSVVDGGGEQYDQLSSCLIAHGDERPDSVYVRVSDMDYDIDRWDLDMLRSLIVDSVATVDPVSVENYLCRIVLRLAMQACVPDRIVLTGDGLLLLDNDATPAIRQSDIGIAIVSMISNSDLFRIPEEMIEQVRTDLRNVDHDFDPMAFHARPQCIRVRGPFVYHRRMGRFAIGNPPRVFDWNSEAYDVHLHDPAVCHRSRCRYDRQCDDIAFHSDGDTLTASAARFIRPTVVVCDGVRTFIVYVQGDERRFTDRDVVVEAYVDTSGLVDEPEAFLLPVISAREESEDVSYVIRNFYYCKRINSPASQTQYMHRLHSIADFHAPYSRVSRVHAITESKLHSTLCDAKNSFFFVVVILQAMGVYIDTSVNFRALENLAKVLGDLIHPSSASFSTAMVTGVFTAVIHGAFRLGFRDENRMKHRLVSVCKVSSERFSIRDIDVLKSFADNFNREHMNPLRRPRRITDDGVLSAYRTIVETPYFRKLLDSPIVPKTDGSTTRKRQKISSYRSPPVRRRTATIALDSVASDASRRVPTMSSTNSLF